MLYYCCPVTKSCLTFCDLMDYSIACRVACQAPLSSTVSQSLLKFMFVGSVMLSNHLILCCPLPVLLSVFPSIRNVFSESALHIQAKILELQLQLQFFQWLFRLIFFRIDWFDLLAVRGTLKRVFFNTAAQKLQFFGIQPSLWSNSRIHTQLLEKP